MAPIDSADLLIRVFPYADDRGSYPVEASLSDGSFFHGSLRLDLATLLEQQRQPAAYGRILCESLFAGPIGRAYDLARGLARARGGRLRVRLWLDERDAALHILPWERLYHTYDEGLCPLSVTLETPFSRYSGLAIARPRPIEGAVRLLFAVASPRDPQARFGLSPVDVAGEVRALRDALADLPQLGVTIMPGQSGLPAALADQLRADGRYRLLDGPASLDQIVAQLGEHQVLHFLGHGRLSGATPTLFMERADGAVDPVPADELIARLRPGAQPHLIFLAACESASGLADRPFSGLGQQLVRAGVPAVVAMQGRLPMQLAPRLQGAFYRQLLQHGYVDLALNSARHQIFSADEEGWDIPVLYTRLETAQLFAPDPLHIALQAICADEGFQLFQSPRYLKLPITVLHHQPLARRTDGASLHDVAASSLADALGAIFAGVDATPRPAGRIVAVLGGHGSNKTTQLQYLAWETASRALDARPGEGRIMPLYISLESSAQQLVRAGALRQLVLDRLGGYWPDPPGQILEGRPGLPTLRLIFDDIEALAPQQRDRIWADLADLAARYPAHEYLVAGRPEFFLTSRLSQADDLSRLRALRWRVPPPLSSDRIDLHVLFVQPLAPDEIRRFLRAVRGEDFGLGRDFGYDLLHHIERARLSDLVRTPSFLYRTFRQASAGHPPDSRVALIQQVADNAVAKVPTQHGMRAHAEQVLYHLAWQMQAARQASWPISRAFAEMEQIRGRRGYGLEDLYGELLKSGALSQIGDDALCFAYPPLQAYCCARAIIRMPDRDQVIDDITAALGRASRLLWWAETLVCLSDLLQAEPETLELLLSKLVYGVNLLEGEQTFVAARCLAEVRDPAVAPDLRRRVINALIWSMNSSNEGHTYRRERAARALGSLGDSAAIPALCRVANQRQRINWRGVAEYELSSVRLAAAQALVPFLLRHSRAIAAADADLAGVLRLWHGQRVRPLIALMQENRPETHAIAAFALGDLQTPAAEAALLAAFRDAAASGDSLWAVTEALTLVSPAPVIAMIRELTADPASLHGGQRQRCLVYLIGRLHHQDERVRAFFAQCLTGSSSTTLIARTLRALGDMHDTSYGPRFEAIAGGDFAYLEAWAAADKPEGDRIYIRRVVIEELGRIGAAATLERLRNAREAHRQQWPPELEEAYYRTSEQIAWRESLG